MDSTQTQPVDIDWTNLVIYMIKVIFNRLPKYSKVFRGLYRISYLNRPYLKQHDHRGQSVLNLVKLAFDSIDANTVSRMRSFHLHIDTSDFGEFSSCKYSESLVPDFNFDKWESVGQYDYSDITQKMINKSKEEPIYNELFWVGSFCCHHTRSELFQMTEQDPRIKINDTNSWHWNNIKNREQPPIISGCHFLFQDRLRYVPIHVFCTESYPNHR